MDRLSYSTFSVARVFMALAVFFCHVFESFNNFGFLFVGVFFFMSGYGMEYRHLRSRALYRLVPLIFLFLFCSLLYWLVYSVFIYPSSWFFVVYFFLMVLYRNISDFRLLVFSFLLLSFSFFYLDFSWGWSASFGSFLFGVFFARRRSLFTLSSTLMLFPLVFLLSYLPSSLYLWFAVPFFAYLVFTFSSFSCLRFLACLAPFTVYFYSFHCFFLGLFRSTWTLGGSPHFLGVIAAFLFTLFVCGLVWMIRDLYNKVLLYFEI